MWLTFTLVAVIACLILFFPGYCLFRAVGFSHIVAFCIAPLGSICEICVLTTCLSLAHVPTNAFMVTLPIAVLSILFLVFSRIRSVRGLQRTDIVRATPITINNRIYSFDALALGCYIVFGIVVCLMVFIPCLTGSPDALFCRWDNQTHLNMIRAFLDAESWSTLRTGYYIGVDSSAIPYVSSTSKGFYPAGWHILSAYICSATGVSVPLGVNAFNAVTSSVVYPASMFLLLKAIFPKNRIAIASGIVITMAFTAFPWALFVKGPLYPNLLTNAVLPGFLGMVILIFEQDLFPRKWLQLAVSSLACFIALTIVQTNAIFSAYVFLAAYGAHYIYRRLSSSRLSRTKSMIIIGCYLAAICIFWTICFNLPFMQEVVRYQWAAIASVPFAILMAGSFAMPSFYPEFLLAFVAVIGLVSCLKQRRYWIIFPALVMMIGFILDRSTSGLIKQFISGFWYNDPFRTAAVYAIFVIPVTCLGFAAIIRWLRKRDFQRLPSLQKPPTLFAAAMLLFCLITYMPPFVIPIGDGLHVKTAFGTLHSRFLDSYRTDIEQVLSTDERAFIEQALEIIPAESLVLNQPCDGSVFAFGTNDLNTYYRSCRAGNQTDAGKAIRLSLVDYVVNDTVQDAVESTGAEYLLQLDQGVAFDEGKWLPQYERPEDWKGIDAVRDDTPGFTILLSEGDMRLYKIGL